MKAMGANVWTKDNHNNPFNLGMFYVAGSNRSGYESVVVKKQTRVSLKYGQRLFKAKIGNVLSLKLPSSICYLAYIRCALGVGRKFKTSQPIQR